MTVDFANDFPENWHTATNIEAFIGVFTLRGQALWAVRPHQKLVMTLVFSRVQPHHLTVRKVMRTESRIPCCCNIANLKSDPTSTWAVPF